MYRRDGFVSQTSHNCVQYSCVNLKSSFQGCEGLPECLHGPALLDGLIALGGVPERAQALLAVPDLRIGSKPQVVVWPVLVEVYRPRVKGRHFSLSPI